MISLLLVEDDIALAYGVEYALKQEGFSVRTARTLAEGRKILNEEIDLILLDIMLPDGNGYDFCSEARKVRDIPIIFMTALEEEANIVLGLDIGGDDYITKPVRIKELVSRINAVLRRRDKKGIHKHQQFLESGSIKLDPFGCKVWVNEKEVSLTPAEYRLLLYMVKNHGIVLSREVILGNLWDINGSFVEGNTLNVYIKRLREKIEEDINNPKFIKTVRGRGYTWVEGVKGLDGE